MAASPRNVDHTTTNVEEVSQPMMIIQHTNLRLVPSLEAYPEELQMLIQTLNNSILSYALVALFVVPMELLSLVALIAVYNKTTKVVTF